LHVLKVYRRGAVFITGVVVMETRSRFKQIASLKDQLVQQAENLRKQAAGMPAGIRRDELVAKARQAERAARVDLWLSSPGLQPPL